MSSEMRLAYTTDPSDGGRPKPNVDRCEATSVRVYSFDANGTVVLNLLHRGSLLGEAVLTKDEVESLMLALKRESREPS